MVWLPPDAIAARARLRDCAARDLLPMPGRTEAEIATITGHSLRDVRSTLDTHYSHGYTRCRGRYP
jgi:hypothetical protein